MESITFISEGQNLNGTLRPAKNSPTKAVIFCHDAFETQKTWEGLAGAFSEEDISTFTFDFTGHGESEGLHSLVDLRIWAHNIRDALNALAARGYHEFALVGWGIGGTAALLAAAHDRRLRCVVTLSTPVCLVPGLGERVAYGLISLVAKIKRAVTKKTLTLSRLNELEEMRFFVDDEMNRAYIASPKLVSAFRAIPVPESLDSVWFDITHMLEKINIPVLVLHGARDEIIPVDQSEKIFAALTTNKKHRIIDNCGHVMHLESQNQETIQLIGIFVKLNLDPGNKRI